MKWSEHHVCNICLFCDSILYVYMFWFSFWTLKEMILALFQKLLTPKSYISKKLLLKTLLTYGTMNWSASQKIAMVIFSWLKYLCCRRWSIFNIKYELIDLRAIGKNCSKWVWKNIYLILVTEKKSFKSESLDQKCYPTPNHDKAVLASHDKTLEISKICAMSTRHVFDTG